MLKCTVATKEFQEAIKRLEIIINNKTKVEVLKHILIKVTDKVELVSTDLKNYVIADIYTGESIQEGACVITNTKELLKSFKFMKEDRTLIEQKERDIVITNGSRTVKLRTMEAEDFPLPPKLEVTRKYNYHTKEFYDRIKKIDFAISKDNSRPPLTGIRFDGKEMITLDGYRLAISEDRKLNIKEPFTLCKEAVDFIVKTTRTLKEDLVIERAKENTVFKFDDITLIAAEIEGEFFNYKDVLPKSLDQEVEVSTKKLKEDMEFLSVYEDTKKPLTEMNITRNNIELKVNNEKGIFTTDIKEDTGFNLDIAFNGKFLLDNLKVIDTDKIKLGFNGCLNPIFIQGEETEKYILLPMRKAS